MPLPPGAFKVSGGCSCGAIRYHVYVPKASHRPLHPRSRPSATTPPTHLPIVFTDHCNDCRRSNGSIIPSWISGPVEWFDVELMLRQDLPSTNRGPQMSTGLAEDMVARLGEPMCITGDRAFSGPHESTANTYLQYYESSPGCIRSFCARCGTHLSFMAPADMPALVDIVLGTVDRKVLEQEWMMPDRQNWCDLAMPWVKGLAEGGAWDRMAKHPKGDYNEYYKNADAGLSKGKKQIEGGSG